MDFGVTGVAAITVLCYLLGLVVKTTGKADRWIPVLCGVCGAVLGLLGKRLIPGFPASDWLDAAAVGAVSGFAATGVNQILKQAKKEK